jgi:signal transduction histidine kinase/CheY-like chemotaxis protein
MHFDEFELVETVPDPAILVHVDGRLVAANKAAARLAAASVTGSLHEWLVDSPDRVSQYLSMCARTRDPLPGAVCWKSGQNVHVDGMLVRPGSESSAALLLLRFRDKAHVTGQFLTLNEKIAALSREIKDRQRAEEERDYMIAAERAARAEAERISRLKDDFLATLSHELRTPLNAILGWAQILRMSPPTSEELEQGLETIERNTRIQAQLIEDLLDMSRIISGKLRLDVQRVDLPAVIEAAVESSRPAFEARNIRLQKVLDPLGQIVSGDPNRLQQVFWNLLSNAAKFTPKGGRVQVLLERVNSHVEVSIIDNGQGIKPEFLPRVFDRFMQVDSSSTRHHGGLGLGLAIVKQLVELHGGTVRVKSPGEGQGSTFVVSLPLTVIHDQENERRDHPRAAPPGTQVDCPPHMNGLKVLVVDDEADALGMVKRVLQMCGCDVDTAGSVEAALLAMDRHRPQVIVSDIGMPGRDGFDLLRAVRARPEAAGGRTPAIALTAFARSEDRRKAMLAGFQLHLAKPVESSELIAAVANVAGLTGTR